MKKLIILLLFVPLVSFGQNPVKVQVTQQKTFAQSFNQGLQAGAFNIMVLLKLKQMQITMKT